MGALAQALAREGALFARDAAAQAGTDAVPLRDIIETTLRLSKLGFIDIVDQARLPDGVNLLLVVDQFEELFRYRQVRDAQAGAATADRRGLRSGEPAPGGQVAPWLSNLRRLDDAIGLSGRLYALSGLAEAINAGQYRFRG